MRDRERDRERERERDRSNYHAKSHGLNLSCLDIPRPEQLEGRGISF
jgi:hypothetical protein